MAQALAAKAMMMGNEELEQKFKKALERCLSASILPSSAHRCNLSVEHSSY
jgi:hypothetical protein